MKILGKIKIFFRNIYYGIRNLFRYFKIIWNDRNWDYTYIFKILQFKIRQVRKLEEKVQRYIGWNYGVKYMKICERLLDILIKEERKYEDFNKNNEYLERCKNLLFKILDYQIFEWIVYIL